MDSSPRLGRFGNQVFRFFFTKYLERLIPGTIVRGYNFPEFGLLSDTSVPAGRLLSTQNVHKVDVDGLLRQLPDYDGILVECFAARLEYFQDRRDELCALFQTDAKAVRIAEHEIVFHIRAGDIMRGVHGAYWPLPISYIRRIVHETVLDPVFVGEFGDDPYTRALRTAFPDARFISNDWLTDFQTIRSASNIAMSVSTFSWLAAWMSDTAKTIHMPVLGLLNPKQRPMVDLIPRDDPRFVFHEFQTTREFRADPGQMAWLIEPNSVYAEGVDYSSRIRPGPLGRSSRRIIRKARKWLSN